MLQLTEASRLSKVRWRWRPREDASGVRIKLEATIEAMGECRQLARGVFCEIKGMVTTNK